MRNGWNRSEANLQAQSTVKQQRRRDVLEILKEAKVSDNDAQYFANWIDENYPV